MYYLIEQEITDQTEKAYKFGNYWLPKRLVKKTNRGFVFKCPYGFEKPKEIIKTLEEVTAEFLSAQGEIYDLKD